MTNAEFEQKISDALRDGMEDKTRTCWYVMSMAQELLYDEIRLSLGIEGVYMTEKFSHLNNLSNGVVLSSPPPTMVQTVLLPAPIGFSCDYQDPVTKKWINAPISIGTTLSDFNAIIGEITKPQDGGTSRFHSALNGCIEKADKAFKNLFRDGDVTEGALTDTIKGYVNEYNGAYPVFNVIKLSPQTDTKILPREMPAPYVRRRLNDRDMVINEIGANCKGSKNMDLAFTTDFTGVIPQFITALATGIYPGMEDHKDLTDQICAIAFNRTIAIERRTGSYQPKYYHGWRLRIVLKFDNDIDDLKIMGNTLKTLKELFQKFYSTISRIDNVPGIGYAQCVVNMTLPQTGAKPAPYASRRA